MRQCNSVKIRGKQLFKGFLFLFLLMLLPLVSACKKEARFEDEKGVKDAIIRFDKALVEVYRKMSVLPLAEVASKREIGKNDSILFTFIKKNVYMEAEFKDIRFKEFRKVSGEKVDVKTWEKWRWRNLDIKTKKEVKPWIEEEYDLIYHMVKDKEKGWIVDSLEFEKK